MNTIILAAAASVSLATNPVEPSSPTAPPKLVAATGVGGCIYRKLPEDISRKAVLAILTHTSIATVLREPVARTAPKCTGQPFSDSDGDVVGAVVSVYARTVTAVTLGRDLHLEERQLYDAWAVATDAERAPFLASAHSFLQPGVEYAAAAPDAAAPLVHRLGIGANAEGPSVLRLVALYYSAMALNELAEARLKARGASATDGR